MTIVAVVAGGLLCVGAAAATTGLLAADGDVVPAGKDPEDPHPHDLEDKTVLARGVSPVAGAWRLSTVSHGATSEEPAGDCVQLLLASPPKPSPIAATLLCQNAGKSDFKADTVPVVDKESGKSEIIIFGVAPESTGSVSLTVDGDKSYAAELREGPTSFPGDAWVVVVPSGSKTGELELTDQNGAERGKLDASGYLDQLAIWERQLLLKTE